MHQHQQQSGSQQWQQAAEQQAKAPPLLLPNSHGVQHTDMEVGGTAQGSFVETQQLCSASTLYSTCRA